MIPKPQAGNVNNYVATTLKVQRVFSVLHVSVSNTNTTLAHVVMFKYFTFSCYYMCRRVYASVSCVVSVECVCVYVPCLCVCVVCGAKGEIFN
jgi:hypothetical protein